MKLLVIFSLIFLLDLYFYLGVYSLFNNTITSNLFKFFYWLSSLIVYLMIIYVILNYEKKTPSIHFNNSILYSSLVFIFLISKFIGIVPLLVDDILRFIKYFTRFFQHSENYYDTSRLEFLKKSSLIASGIIFSTFLMGMKWGRYNFKKNFQDIKIDKWPTSLNGFKIVHISDLHLGSFQKVEKLELVVEMINEENPDIVVFTGDLVNNYYYEALPYVNTLKKIKARIGKFSILGNHDYCDYTNLKRSSIEWKKNFNNLLKLQKDAGFDLLLNESRVIDIKNYKFNIVGVENWGAGNFNKDGDLDLSMNDVNDKIPTILLSHDPSHWSEKVLNSDYNIDLQLSGHTHGMQFGIEIPGFKWSPVKYRYSQWAGLYNKHGKQIYVNRGVGHLGYAGRVGIMPDISVLKLYSKI